jgi:hypothetical protein
LSAAHHFWVQYTLAAWVALSFGVWVMTHDIILAEVTCFIAFAGAVVTCYYLIYLVGLLDPPGALQEKIHAGGRVGDAVGVMPSCPILPRSPFFQ